MTVTPRGVRADQPGPRPPGLARGRGALLPGQAPAHRCRATRGPGRQCRQRRGGAAHRTHTEPDPVRAPGAGCGSTGSGSRGGRRRAAGAPAGRCGCPGRHNVWNLCGAIAGALLLDGRSPSGRRHPNGPWTASTGCRPGAGPSGDRGGLTFVDDALASNPFATVASLGAFPGRELTVIVGGADRGVDPTGLVEALAHRRPAPRVMVLPPDPERPGRRAGRPYRPPADRLRWSRWPATSRTPCAGRWPPPPPAGWSCSLRPPRPPRARVATRERSRRFVDAAGVSEAD